MVLAGCSAGRLKKKKNKSFKCLIYIHFFQFSLMVTAGHLPKAKTCVVQSIPRRPTPLYTQVVLE